MIRHQLLTVAVEVSVTTSLARRALDLERELDRALALGSGSTSEEAEDLVEIASELPAQSRQDDQTHSVEGPVHPVVDDGVDAGLTHGQPVEQEVDVSDVLTLGKAVNSTSHCELIGFWELRLLKPRETLIPFLYELLPLVIWGWW